jgi:hypothetical protein
MPNADAPAPPWYAAGLRFECTRCGNCCSGAPGYVWVSDDEIAALARRLSLTPAQFTERHTRVLGRRRSLLEQPGGDCEFLRRQPAGLTTCAVHDVRPVQCRTWPFWRSNLESEETWVTTARECPGIGRGPTHPLPVIQAQKLAGVSRPL